MQASALPLGHVATLAAPSLKRPAKIAHDRPCADDGADDGVRTRDPDLGKVVLYQLSHVRVARRYNNGTHPFAQVLIFDFLSVRKRGRCGQRDGNAATRAMREIARKPLSQALGDCPGKQSGRRRFRAPPFHAKGEKHVRTSNRESESRCKRSRLAPWCSMRNAPCRRMTSMGIRRRPTSFLSARRPRERTVGPTSTPDAHPGSKTLHPW